MARPGEPGRRYRRRQTVAMAVYAATLVLVIEATRRLPPTQPGRWMLAVLPALPILFIIWAVGRYLLEETDEVIRTKVVLQILGGAAAALSASTLWGFLETFGGLPHLPAYMVFPVFCLGMLLATPFVRWKYG